jgi:hypothetical protein
MAKVPPPARPLRHAKRKKLGRGRLLSGSPQSMRSQPKPVRRYGVTPEGALSILPKLADMRLDQLKALWENAVGILANKKRTDLHAAATTILDEIERQWNERSKRPIGSNEFFKWPSTEAVLGENKIELTHLLEEGMLSYLGYRVGNTQGISSDVRRQILCQIFERHLPPVFPEGYLMEWSLPKSSQRLRKMAETLAAFARNAKRRDEDALFDAVRSWELDLHHLYDRYYVGYFQFAWPDTTIE